MKIEDIELTDIYDRVIKLKQPLDIKDVFYLDQCLDCIMKEVSLLDDELHEDIIKNHNITLNSITFILEENIKNKKYRGLKLVKS
jgi:hypothetical protein